MICLSNVSQTNKKGAPYQTSMYELEGVFLEEVSAFDTEKFFYKVFALLIIEDFLN